MESLEHRNLLAVYTWNDAANTLAVSLATNESLTVTAASGTVSFALSAGTFTQSGGNAAPGGGAGTLALASADLTGAVSVNNSLAASGTNDVTFSGSGSLASSTIAVNITDSDAVGTINFTGGFDITASSDITLTSNRDIKAGAGSNIAATGGGSISLSANLQSPQTSGGFIAVDINGGSILGAAGPVSVRGRGGLATTISNYGVRVGTGSQITAISGSVFVQGTGGGTGVSSDNFGILLNAGGVITNQGTGAGSTVTVIGIGGSASGNVNHGILLDGAGATITANGGAVSVDGTGGGIGGSAGNHGIVVDAGGMITNAGTSAGAAVTVVGHGGNTTGTGFANNGVAVDRLGSRITSGGGPVSVTGTGGGFSGDQNFGVRVTADAQITNAGTANTSTVTVVGTGGNSSANLNYGVIVEEVGAQISSNGGPVAVTGTGGGIGTSASNHGVFLNNGGVITTGLNAALDLKGFGGNSAGSGTSNVGVFVSTANSKITSGGGAVVVEGRGGGGATSASNFGVFVTEGTITNAGTGVGATVTVRAWGGNASGPTNHGLVLNNATSLITSNGGAVLVEAAGGGNGASVSNHGVYFDAAGTITSAGPTASVTVRGFGGNLTGSGGFNEGVLVASAASQITSSGGPVLVEGFGGGTGATGNNIGTRLNGGIITNAGSAAASTVTVRGFGGNASGSLNNGVVLNSAGSSITSGGGAILIEASAGGAASAAVVAQAGGQIVGNTGTLTVTVVGDSMDFQSPSSINAGTNTVVLRPRTAGTHIDLGGADVLSGSPRTLGLADAELDRITAGLVQIGNIDSGALTVSAAVTHNNHLSLTTGSTITVNQPVTMAAIKNFSATAVDTISLPNATSDVTTTGTGAISLTTSRNVALGSGASLITVDGNLSVSANQQGTPSTGNFRGVNVVGGLIQATGTGAVTVMGKGGDDPGGSQFGVSIVAGGGIAGGTSGLVTAQGAGGTSGGEGNIGILVTGLNSTIVSNGGNVVVNGNGGGMGASVGNFGILLDAAGSIKSGGSGTALVQGTGGNISGTDGRNHGVYLSGANTGISSMGGDVTVNGTIGGTADINFNYGVIVDLGSSISAGGNGMVRVEGRGDNPLDTTGIAPLNRGVYVNGTNSAITTSGGNLVVIGTGGGRGASQGNDGVTVRLGGRIVAEGLGSVTVEGHGGNLTGPGIQNRGVLVEGTDAVISSSGGDVTVNGYGGGGTTSTGNAGVYLEGGGVITAGANGLVVVHGEGGNLLGSGNSNYGVIVGAHPSQITSGGANVTVSGIGGGGVGSFNNTGVFLGGIISAGGGGSVFVTGQGGSSTPPAGENDGVFLLGPNAAITSPGGDVVVTGVEGGANTGRAIVNAATGGMISTLATGGTVKLIGNSMAIGDASFVSAPSSGSVIIQQRTAGVAINLGTSLDPRNGPIQLTDTELDRITAGTLRIGDANSGAITVTANITRPAATNVELLSGGDIVVSGGQINTGGGTLLLDSGNSPAAVKPTNSGVDVTASALSFGGDLAMVLNGVMPDTLYSQLNLVGQVNLTGVNLLLSGSYVPAGLQSFVLVNNDGNDAVVGTFVGLAEGAVLNNFFGSGHRAVLSYRGGDGNDVLLTVQPTTMWVDSFTPTSTGVRFTFSQAAAVVGLNLYDFRDTAGQNVMGAADVQLVGPSGNTVLGSLIVETGDTGFTFIATGGVLPAGNYSLTLRSAADGFHTTGGALLDGNADNIPGGNYVMTFTVAAPPVNAVTVSLPFFSRGPLQSVNAPASSALGIPLTLSNASGLVSLNFELRFDSGLLDVTNLNLAAGLPGGSTKSFTLLSPGRAQVAMTFGAALPVGPLTVGYLTATVPTAAAARYGERGVLDLTNLTLLATGGVPVPALDQDAPFAIAYLGDVSRDGGYNSFDVQQVSRAAVGLDGGFQQHLLLDPRIIADFDKDAAINSFDVQQISSLAVGLPITNAPPLPASPPVFTNTGRLTADDPPPDTTTAKPPVVELPPQHNVAPGLRADVNGDGAVDSQDILWAVYLYNQSLHEDSALSASAPSGLFADVNGDQQLDPADILFAVWDFNLRTAAEGESAAAAPRTLSADSSDLMEDLDTLACLIATDLETVRKRK